MKMFIVLSESPLKARTIAVYHFLISLLVLELLRSKIWKTTKQMVRKIRIKIDIIYGIVWWTSDSKQSLNILCLGKYMSESLETLKAKTTRHYSEDIWKNWLYLRLIWKNWLYISVPGPFNGDHEMRHNSAVTRQNQLEFWNQKAKQIFSWQSKSFGP